MKRYNAKDKVKSVREVAPDVTQPYPVKSKLAMLMLGIKFNMLRALIWVTGFFRLNGDPGSFLMLHTDGHADRRKTISHRQITPGVRGVMAHSIPVKLYCCALLWLGTTILPHSTHADSGNADRLIEYSLEAETSTLWSENWEGDWLADWSVEGGTWEVGASMSGPESCRGGDNCAATVLHGNYAENVDTRLIRFTPFEVPAASENPRLRFWHWFDFSSNDHGEVQISTDGGTTWETISPAYTSTGSGVWTRPSLDLSAHAGQTVQVAFFFQSRPNQYGRTFVSSGWYLDEVELVTGPLAFTGFEDWEDGLGDWSEDRGTWEVGAPTSGPDSAYSGSNVAATVLGGNYHENVDSRLISPAFVVPAASENPRLRFWHWFDFSSNDHGEVQISTDGGTTWETILGPYSATSSNVWSIPSFDLAPYTDQTVQIAFFFQSRRNQYGRTFVSSGWYIDDIFIQGFVAPQEPNIAVSPVSHDFGDVEVDSIAAHTFVIRSTGQLDLEVSDITLGGDAADQFEIESVCDQLPLTLAPEDECEVMVHFGPTSPGDKEAMLQIENNDPQQNRLDIQLQGHGVDPQTVSTEHDVPYTFALHQNYPNPFNPYTTIRFTLPQAANVTLTIYDLLGREVEVLVSEHLSAGEHQTVWGPRSLPSGVYQYRLEAGSFTQTKKLVFLK